MATVSVVIFLISSQPIIICVKDPTDFFELIFLSSQFAEGETVKKEEHTPISVGIANLYKHSGNKSGIFSENWK